MADEHDAASRTEEATPRRLEQAREQGDVPKTPELPQLASLCDGDGVRPAFVQNRCYASSGWDREVRAFCRTHDIVYQGFSLLTANPEVLASSLVRRIATRERVTPPQVVFRFALAVGMLPLTGTSDREHMTQDLASPSVTLSPDEVESIESMAG